MIDFIYMALIFILGLLALGFFLQEIFITAIGAMAMIVSGVYMAINGVGDFSNFLTQGFSIILICLGAYIFIRVGLEQIQTF